MHAHPYSFAVDAAAATDIGKQRDHNEDSYVFDAENGIYLVADGIGGHVGGEVASDIAVTIAHQALIRDRSRNLQDAFGRANKAVWRAAEKDASLRGMGTTLVGIASIGSEVSIAHTGDSRAYLLRSKALLQITEDHSAPAPYHHVIINAIGVHPDEPVVDVRTVKAVSGDVFLLCSDGLSNAISDRETRHILSNTNTSKSSCRRLIEAALHAGGPDNVTVIVIRIA